jgi:hypothetical protein
MLAIVQCLWYIRYPWRFGSWLFLCLEVTGYHYTERFIVTYFYFNINSDSWSQARDLLNAMSWLWRSSLLALYSEWECPGFLLKLRHELRKLSVNSITTRCLKTGLEPTPDMSSVWNTNQTVGSAQHYNQNFLQHSFELTNVIDLRHCLSSDTLSFQLKVIRKICNWSRVLKKLTAAQLVRNSLFLWISKFHYRVHKSPSLDSVSNQMNPVHTLISRFFKRDFNIIIPGQWYSAELQAGWSGAWVTAGAGNFSLHHRVQTGSGAHPVSYPMGRRGSLPGGKAAGAWSWPLTSI